ncbi:hypothetical protein FQN57_005298 [Myotisia sp. PD_48]|nr:hypothetical protein FQN57_005298 [Myotisia sp. PD_48]
MAYQHCQTSSFQPCDTFFVETYDDDYAPARPGSREHAKIMARERQLDMAEQMSRAVTDEYQADILAHMHMMDSATVPDVDAIDMQTEIKWFMRPYLLDFLVEAHAAFQLLPATLFLTVNLLDRYCSKRVVYKRHYQLVGCAALLIAAKYGDKKDRVPTIKELKTMCCSLYDDDMFVQMEWHVLQTLGWSVGHPTVDSFLQIAVVDTHYDPEVEHLAQYIAEVALFHREFVSKLASDLARASLALARCILSRPQPSQSDWASNYDSLTLVSLSQYVQKPSLILSKKYSSAHYSRVSKTLEHFLARQEAAKHYEPPTPPTIDRVCEPKPYENEIGLSTPQKGQYPAASHGYITPPITPENEGFGAPGNVSMVAKDVDMVYGCPSSPSPAPPIQYSAQHYPAHDATGYSHTHLHPQHHHHHVIPQPSSTSFNAVF